MLVVELLRWLQIDVKRVVYFMVLSPEASLNVLGVMRFSDDVLFKGKCSNVARSGQYRPGSALPNSPKSTSTLSRTDRGHVVTVATSGSPAVLAIQVASSPGMIHKRSDNRPS